MLHYYFYKVRWYVGIALLLCLAITVMKYSAWLDSWIGFKQPRTTSQQTVQPADQAAPAIPLPVGAHGGATPAPTTADVHVQLSQAKSLLSEASVFASEAMKGVLTWQSDVEPLRSQIVDEPVTEGSDEQAKLFDRLAYVMRKDRTSGKELGEASTRIETWRQKIDGLMKQSAPPALTADELAQISELHTRCKKASEDWQRDVGQALAIKHLIYPPGTAPGTTEPPTIGDKIEEADARAAVADLDEQMKFDQEQEAQERARLAEIEEQRRQQEQQEAELLAKATSPEVKVLLAPFLEPRAIQPDLAGTFSIRFVRSNETKPMSLEKLVTIGVLDDSVAGRQKLALVAGNRKLPEPKWSIASQPNHWSPEDESRLKQAQQMLRDYGPILVKEGLLSK